MDFLSQSKEGKKLEEIYNDLSLNVCNIYERTDIVMAMDLVFHSLLGFKFRGDLVTRGWLDILIVGDTRTGKTKIASSLIQHYKLGELITGENVSKAGLIAGVNQISKNWMITWGKLPINDRRLVVIDEVSGLSESLISDLSGVRSSGVAEVTKIIQQRALARVRLIWLSNPQGRRGMDTYSHPVYAIQDIIKRPEDIARFDYACVLKSDDVSIEIVNAKKHNTIKHKYTSELCNKLLLWIWSRKPEHITFTPASENAILDYSIQLGTRFSSEIPLIEPNEIRIKLARISASVAARLFSTKDGIGLLIEKAHVAIAVNFLMHIYDKLGYVYFSDMKLRPISDDVIEEVKRMLITKGNSFVEGLININSIIEQDIVDISGEDYHEAQALISFLVGRSCLRRYKRAYYKQPILIRILKDLEQRRIKEYEI